MFSWVNLKPSISPGDFSVHGILTGYDGNIKELKLVLNKKTEKNLVAYNNYFYTVYLFASGYRYLKWDFPDNPELKSGFSLGSHSLTERTTLKFLSQYGFNLDIREPLDIDGFMYTGNKFPASISYYFLDQNTDSKSILVVVTYYQTRFGKDLSWTEFAPIFEVSQLNTNSINK